MLTTLANHGCLHLLVPKSSRPSASQAQWVTSYSRPRVALWNNQALWVTGNSVSTKLFQAWSDRSATSQQSQQSSAVVFNLLASPVPATLAVKGDTFEDSQMDTDLPCSPPLPDSLTQKYIHWAYQV